MDESRKAFERWFNQKSNWKITPSMRMANGYVNNPSAQSKWEVWQASRDAIDIEVPGWDMFDTTRQIVGAIEDELRAAGIKVKE